MLSLDTRSPIHSSDNVLRAGQVPKLRTAALAAARRLIVHRRRRISSRLPAPISANDIGSGIGRALPAPLL